MRIVERIEMQSVGALVEERSRVLGRDLEPDPARCCLIVGLVEAGEERIGDREAGESAHCVQVFEIGDWQDAGNDRDRDACMVGPPAQPGVGAGVEEELGDGEVRAVALFGGQDIEVLVQAGRLGMCVADRGGITSKDRARRSRCGADGAASAAVTGAEAETLGSGSAGEKVVDMPPS